MELIEQFQKLMEEKKYDIYIVPTSDYHSSEYICDYFKSRELLTNFNGSQGTLLVTKNKAYLFVDGRYHIQAEKQVTSKKIVIMKVGLNGVKTLPEILDDIIEDNMIIGFDAKTMPLILKRKLFNKYGDKIKFKTDYDLINDLWPERPKMPFSLIYKLEDVFSGMPYNDKIELLRNKLEENQNDILLLSSLEDIAWTYNLRGNDILHTPVFYSFAVISKKDSILFVDKNKISDDVKLYLKENDVKIKDYDSIYDYMSKMKSKKVSIDIDTINCQLFDSFEKKNEITNKVSPVKFLKCIKNETEIKNIKSIHAKDGAMIVKLMYYLKKKNSDEISELSVGKYIDDLRSKIEGFIDLSFDTIAAFNEHGPMMHYIATEETNTIINKSGFLLVDSGGHYLDGTTDITRTFGIGRIGDEMKTNYTLVLKSLIALASAKFLEGTTTQSLDILARAPIWANGMDYKCGTGHGVGYLLSVHEGPNNFSWKNKNSVEMKPGMITTNEPGIYIEDNYGIRLENEMLCVLDTKNENGNFLSFETITYAPFDLDCIKISLLTKNEKEWINSYHDLVYKKTNKYLTKDEKEWLKEITKKI